MSNLLVGKFSNKLKFYVVSINANIYIFKNIYLEKSFCTTHLNYVFTEKVYQS